MLKYSQLILTLVLSLVATQMLLADPIVSGSSSGYCSVEMIKEEPFKIKQPVPTGIKEPASCPDYSGVWQGGCFIAVVRPVLHTPTGEAIFTADTVLPENVWTTVNLNGKPNLVPTHTIRVTQSGCNTIAFEAPSGSPVEGTTADISKDSVYTRYQNFSRECKAGNSSWLRTYEMDLFAKLSSRWNASNTSFTIKIQMTGNDTKYGAKYEGIERTRYTVTQDQLRFDTAIWMAQSNYNPPGFNFDPPDVAGRICIYKKQPF